MVMFRRCLTVLLGLTVVGLVGCSGSSSSEKASESKFKKEYRMQVTVGPQTYWGMGAARFVDMVRVRTGGRINIKPYFGSQLLKGAQLNCAQMVASGAIDVAFESTINTAPVIPEMNVFSLPFFINTYDRLDALENGETGARIFDAMKEKGLMPLAWGENGFRQLTNSKRPVRRPEDLKGLKVRVVGSAIFTDIFRALGADPVNMNWGDAVTAFQQGTVDGQENPAAILTTVKIYQYHDHGTFWNYLVDPLIIYWCKKEWDAFPEDIQQGILKAAQEAARYEKALCRAGLDGSVSLDILKNEFQHTPKIDDPIAFLEGQGMAIVELTPDDRAAFQQAVKPVFDQWVARLGPSIYQGALRDMEGLPSSP